MINQNPQPIISLNYSLISKGPQELVPLKITTVQHRSAIEINLLHMQKGVKLTVEVNRFALKTLEVDLKHNSRQSIIAHNV